MEEIKQMTIDEAKKKHEAKEAVFLDIRDPGSYEDGHIEGALHLTEDKLPEFLQTADKERCTIICCYHGNMSQGAAAYFAEQGFKDVYSLVGGYTAWADL